MTRLLVALAVWALLLGGFYAAIYACELAWVAWRGKRGGHGSVDA